MNIKDDLLNLLGVNEPAQNADFDSQIEYPMHLSGGLCTICINRNHCVWVDDKKNYCEHYE